MTPSDRGSGLPPKTGWGRWAPTGLRMASHAVIWAVLVVPTAIELSDGWRPVRDDSMISIGAYRVFTADPPLVGVWSLASEGMRHAFFDVGPLLFWVLAVPVRLDGGQGALWGATLVCGVALSVAAEAAWAVKGWPACVAVALVAADVGWQTQLYSDVLWNPHIGLVCFGAAAVLAWAVASGRFGWWPPAVLFASLAAQCHFLYVIPAIVIAVAAPLFGLALGFRPPGRRWLVTGLGIGALCWLAPLAQEAFVRPGNLSLILQSGDGHPRIGTGFGLHALATAADPRPIWLTSFPYLSALVNRTPQYITGHASGWGGAAPVLVVAIAGLAWATGRRELAALAGVGAAVSLAVVASFAALPADNLSVLSYLINALWVVGALLWIIAAWGLAELTAAVLRRRPVGARDRSGPPAVVVAGVTLAVLLAAAAVALHTLVPSARGRVGAVQVDRSLDEAIAGSVERSVARGPVVVQVDPSSFGPRYGYYSVDYWGVAYELLTDGWRPGLIDGFFGQATHLSVPRGAHWPEVRVFVDRRDRSVVGVRRATYPAISPGGSVRARP